MEEGLGAGQGLRRDADGERWAQECENFEFGVRFF